MSVLHEESHGDIKLLSYKHLVQLLHKLSRSMGKWKQNQSERWYPFAVRPCSPHWDTVPPQTLSRPTLLQRTHPVTFLRDRCFCFAMLKQICPLLELSRSNIRHAYVDVYSNNVINKDIRTALFWVIAQQVVVILYRRFGTTYRSRIHESIIGFLTHELIGFPESSVKNYHYSLRNDPEQRGSRLFSGGSLKSRNRDTNS